MCVLPFELHSHSVAAACSTRRPFRFTRSASGLLTGLSLLAPGFGISFPARAAENASALSRLAPASRAKLAPAMRAQLRATTSDSTTLLPVIIQTDGKAPAPVKAMLGKTSLAAFASARRTATRPALVALQGELVLAARLSARDIAALADDAHTQHVSPDLPLQACDANVGYADYALEATGADFAQTNHHLSGQGVTVAVVDTGIYPHDDLGGSASRVVGWNDLVQNVGHPYDDNGHGTHVAGLVAGSGVTSATNGYNVWMGRTAPQTRLVGVKVLDRNGGGSVSTVIAGINWVIAHKTEYNIRVLNLSVGHPIGESYATDPLCQACERACDAGIVVVVAAGNSGRSVPSDPNSPTQFGSITSPGNDPRVITVGAVNTRGTFLRSDDTICTYSSRGPSLGDLVLKPDIVAPGNNVVSLAAPGSTLFTQAGGNLLDPAGYGGTGSKSYMVLSGTSMAAPVVSGAAALLLEADPTLSPDTVKARLMLSATKTANMDTLSYGAGYLNVVGALALTQVRADHALSPCLLRDNTGIIGITNFAWGGNIANQNFGWGYNGPEKDKITADNFGWGDNGPVEKPKGAFSESDCLTVQNFGWGDNGFAGLGVFGPQQLPANVGPTDPTLWNGSIVPLNVPDQADSMSLLRVGD